MAALECLTAGIGTVWDHYYAGREVAEACRETGLGAVVAPTLQDLDGPGVSVLDDQIQATLDIAGDARLAGAGVVAALGPHATDTVSGPLWARLADLASTHGLPFHAHAAQSAEEYARSMERHGVSPFAWLAREGWLQSPPSSLLVHGLYAHLGDLSGLDPTRVVLGHCPASQMQYCFPAYTSGWRVAGFKMAVGTDCGACNDGMNVQQELRLVSGGPMFAVAGGQAYRAFWHGGADRAADVARERSVRLAWSEQQPSALLATVWDVPGRLHPKLRVGRIEAGHRANLVVFDLDHPAFWPGSDPLRALALQDVTHAIDRMSLTVTRSRVGLADTMVGRTSPHRHHPGSNFARLPHLPRCGDDTNEGTP
jgi:5-methylthioadenosine/S-adenosylhomocysteine deaminase